MSSYGVFTKCYFADTSRIQYEQRRLNYHRKSLLEHNPEFFKQLAIVLKTKFRVHSFIDTYKRDHPAEYCPATATVYRYIDQGLLAVAKLSVKWSCA